MIYDGNVCFQKRSFHLMSTTMMIFWVRSCDKMLKNVKKEHALCKPFLASDVFSTVPDEVVICSSLPLPDPCSPSSFVPISSFLKPSGVQSFLLETLFWQEHRRTLNKQWKESAAVYECVCIFPTSCGSSAVLCGAPGGSWRPLQDWEVFAVWWDYCSPPHSVVGMEEPEASSVGLAVQFGVSALLRLKKKH